VRFEFSLHNACKILFGSIKVYQSYPRKADFEQIHITLSYMGLVSFLPPTITVEALKATHSTDPNQCHGLIFSLSRTGHPTQMDATPFMISFENRPTSFPGKREPNLGFFSCFSLFYVILFFCVSDA